MTKDEAKKFHDIARNLACAMDLVEELRERAFHANRYLHDAEKQARDLRAALEPSVSAEEPRALFTFDGKTAITVVHRQIDANTSNVEFHYDRRVLRGS